MPFKTYELFISGIFHLICSDHGCLWVTETIKSKTVDKGGLLYKEVWVSSPVHSTGLKKKKW